MNTILDKSKDLIEYLNHILMDSDGNRGWVTRGWKGELIEDGVERGYIIYRYTNIKYGKPFIQPLSNRFNEEDELLILGIAKEQA